MRTNLRTSLRTPEDELEDGPEDDPKDELGWPEDGLTPIIQSHGDPLMKYCCQDCFDFFLLLKSS